MAKLENNKQTKIDTEIIKELIKSKIKNPDDLNAFKRKVAKKYKIGFQGNCRLLKNYHKLLENKSVKQSKIIERLLKKRPIRSLSGIINISIFTKPYPCPGKCIYCPQQKGVPKSYLKNEPAAQRAILNNFSPYLQIQNRLKALASTGHPLDKIELRIIGGTWSFYPKKYQTWFVKECFRAANDFPSFKKEKKAIGSSLAKEQKKNEKAKHRIIGVTIETRPDFINIEEVKRLRKLGITRVEIGVQSIYNDVLEANRRGHDVQATINATRLLKNAGFKVSYQMMPDLPGSSFKKDIKMFEEIFSDPRFKPDLLKIYPLALLKEAPLYKKYLRGEYKPYNKEKLIKLLIEIKQKIPYWCRIQRIIRDISAKDIVEGGVKISNLREIAQDRMAKMNLRCKCIRCREIRNNYDPKEKIYLFREDYEASQGREIFLSFENKKRSKLFALLRLRINRETEEIPFVVLKKSAIIREIHTYGVTTPVGEKPLSAQHKGLGKRLIKEAEKIAKGEFGLKKIVAISGIGVREYFRKFNYRLENTYMAKRI